jgi:hypothetical protein
VHKYLKRKNNTFIKYKFNHILETDIFYKHGKKRITENNGKNTEFKTKKNKVDDDCFLEKLASYTTIWVRLHNYKNKKC